MEMVNRGGEWPRDTNPYAFDYPGKERRLGIDFRVSMPEGQLSYFPGNDVLSVLPVTIEIRLRYAWFSGPQSPTERAGLVTVSIIQQPTKADGEPLTLFDAERLPPLPEDTAGPQEWYFGSQALGGRDYEPEYNVWPIVSIEQRNEGFLPHFFVPAHQRRYQTDEVTALSQLLDTLAEQVANVLENIEYVRPLRPEPRRTYVLDEEAHTRLQDQGRGAFLRLIRGEFDGPQMRQLNSWLADMGLGAEIRPEPRFKDAGNVVSSVTVIEKDDAKVESNLTDVGYGASQVIPVLAQAALADTGSLTLIEQPELHLHPQAQARLGDIFIQSSVRGVRVLIETHSEHLILRLQRRIRRSELKPERIAVYYATRRDGCSFLHPLTLDDEGDFVEAWPDGFFPERLEEMFDLPSDGSDKPSLIQ
jgi:hypothetical protein